MRAATRSYLDLLSCIQIDDDTKSISPATVLKARARTEIRSKLSAQESTRAYSDSRHLFGGDFGVATEAAKSSRGSDPRLLGLTMGRLLDRTFGVRPRASRIVQARGLDQPSIT
jgi:hypothetical protein